MNDEKRTGTERVPLPSVPLDEFSAASREDWEKAAGAALAPKGGEPVTGPAFEKRMFTPTYEGITLHPMYTADDTADIRAARTYPGLYALRGNTASGSLGRPWEIAQFCDASDPAEANRAMKRELERGATTVAFRLDGPIDEGRAGTLFSGLLNRPLHVETGASSLPLLKIMEPLARKDGLMPRAMTGCVGADPLGTLLEAGSLPKKIDELWDEMAETFRWVKEKDTSLKTVLIRAGTVAHNGGATAAQEAAMAMTAAIETFRAMSSRGITIDEFAGRLRFEFSQGANFFMEIAKIRAARQVWAKIAESFGGGDDARRSDVFARTSSFTKTVYDPYVNMLRNTTEAFSAVVAGVEGLTVVPFDSAFKAQSELSSRQARNAQIMLQKEFNLLEPVDPAGGSWYVESLTAELAGKIWQELQKIEGQGGFLKSVNEGLIQKDVDATLQERFRKLAKRSDRAVGTNMYPNISEPLPDWSGMKTAAAGPADVMPVLPRRWTEQFEALRRRTEEYRAAHGGDNVRIFLANMGPIPQHKARADFITGFMEVAAFDVLRNDGFGTVEDCAEAAAKSCAVAAVICSTDKTYPEIVPPLAKAIKEKAPSMRVYLAGEPAAEFRDAYTGAGVDGFISVRSNCLDTLTEFQKIKGMN